MKAEYYKIWLKSDPTLSLTAPSRTLPHVLMELPGGPLNYQESCLMTLEREAIGITVNFRHPNEIGAIAAGIPIADVAALFGWQNNNELITYLNRSLRGGGYMQTSLATALYRFRHMAVHPNFVNLAEGNGGGAAADTVMVHIHQPHRISKNAKELSYNSILDTPEYRSIKDIINNQYDFLELPVPDSATLLTADRLQLN